MVLFPDLPAVKWIGGLMPHPWIYPIIPGAALWASAPKVAYTSILPACLQLLLRILRCNRAWNPA
jgi:hypothetical protein